jgi:hypothetical protein
MVMKSVFRILAFVMPIVAALCIVAASIRPSIVVTGDYRDLTILGRGYFAVLDEAVGIVKYRRSLRLGIDVNGTLCDVSDGHFKPVDPPMAVLSDWNRLDVDQAGVVTVHRLGNSWTTIGELQVTCFTGDDTDRNNQYFGADSESSTPQVSLGGLGGAGHIMQGYAYRPTIPLGVANVIVLGTLVAYLLGFTIYLAAVRTSSTLLKNPM